MAKDASFVVNSIFSIGFLVSAILLSIFHLYGANKNAKTSLCSKKMLNEYPSLSLSYILMTINVLSGLSLTLDSVFTTSLCSYAQYYGPSLYTLFKANIYLILGCRIYISFKGSIYAYSPRKLSIWCIIVIIWTLFNIIAGNMTVTSNIEQETANQDTKCIVTPSVIYIMGQGLLDFISMIVNCILFVIPVCKLYKLSNENINIKKIAIKQCILSVIAVISSVVALAGIGAVSHITPTFVSVDMFISTCCVILMYKWNSKITESLFCCCMPKLQTRENATNKNEGQAGFVMDNGQQKVPSNTDGQISIVSGTGNSNQSGSTSNSNSTKQNATHSMAASTTMTKTVLTANNSNTTQTRTVTDTACVTEFTQEIEIIQEEQA